MSIDAVEQSISEWIRKEFPLVDIETDWSDNNWHETRFSPTLFVRYFSDRLRMVWLSKGSTGFKYLDPCGYEVYVEYADPELFDKMRTFIDRSQYSRDQRMKQLSNHVL